MTRFCSWTKPVHRVAMIRQMRLRRHFARITARTPSFRGEQVWTRAATRRRLDRRPAQPGARVGPRHQRPAAARLTRLAVGSLASAQPGSSIEVMISGVDRPGVQPTDLGSAVHRRHYARQEGPTRTGLFGRRRRFAARSWLTVGQRVVSINAATAPTVASGALAAAP